MNQEITKNNISATYSSHDIAIMAYDAHLMLPYYIQESPLIEFIHTSLDGSKRTVLVKDETVQPGNSFKDRGAAYAVGRYVMNGIDSVITASAGNHGLGVARAAQYYDIESTVVLPSSAEDVKKNSMRELGANIIEISGDFLDAEVLARKLSTNSGSQLIHPFADPFVAAGQGSIAVELLKQIPNVSETYITVGGGGLILGFGSVIKHSPNNSLVIASQPIGANTFTKSYNRELISSTEYIDAEYGGLAVRKLDPRTFYLGSLVTDLCIQVTSLEVYKAIFEWRELTGRTLEPAAAVGLAASVKAPQFSESISSTIVTGSNASFLVNEKVNKLASENNW